MNVPIRRALAMTATLAFPAAAEQPTVLTNVTVIGAAEVRPGQSVVIVGDRIEAVGPAAAVRVPPGARVVEGRGSFAIPGLWDMHTHLASYPGALPLLVAYGVGHCSVIIVAGTSTELVQRYLNWNEQSKGATAVKVVCGVLVLLGGVWLIYSAP